MKEIIELGFLDGDRVLDLGCGCGFIAATVAAIIGQQGYLLCIDSQAEMVEATRNRLAEFSDRTEVRQQLIEELIFASGEGDFDVVLLMNVAAYQDDPLDLIKMAFSWVRLGGRLIVRSSDFRLSVMEPIDHVKYAELIVAAHSNQRYE